MSIFSGKNLISPRFVCLNQKQMSKIVGSKGADVYSSTGSSLVDLSVSLVRGETYETIDSMIQTILSGDSRTIVLLVVLMFHVRNIRGGKGERDISFHMFKSLYNRNPDVMLTLLDLVPEYGCWGDLLTLSTNMKDARFQDAVMNLFATQLRKDLLQPDTDLSLCAKWAPKEGKSNDALAKALAEKLFPKKNEVGAVPKQLRLYRKLVSSINARLKTVETFMAARKFAQITPSAVPGRAGKLYSRAYLNLVSTFQKHRYSKLTRNELNEVRYPNDEDRVTCGENFRSHFAKAKEGKAKVHGSDTLFPHELVKKATTTELSESEKDQLIAIWRKMVDKAKSLGGLGKALFMCDFSGSMQGSRQGDLPYWVSLAIGMLGSEVCSEEFRNLILTFDSTPSWHRFPDGDLFARLASISGNLGQGLSTDFQAAMNLVIQRIKDTRVKPGQEPETLIVLTDMNWDAACNSSKTSLYTGNQYRHHVKTEDWQTHLDMIKETFRRVGEDMWGTKESGGLGGFQPPRIVIWNLSAGPTDFQAMANTPGVSMLSGWSPSQFSVLQTLGPIQVSAYETLLEELAHSQYDLVRDRLEEFANC